jgi:hypothetical protein
VWITAVVLAALVIGGDGAIWFLRGFALRATYRAEPGKLTLGIQAEVLPTYQGMELPPARYMNDDVPPLLEIPRTSTSDDARRERGQAVEKYNAAVRAINAHSLSEQQIVRAAEVSARQLPS